MDIFEWVFTDKHDGAKIPQVKRLGKSIKKERKFFNEFWKLVKKKERLSKHKSHAAKIISKNKKLLKFLPTLTNRNIIIPLLKNILFESSEGLHKIEGYLHRYGSTPGEIWDRKTKTPEQVLQRRNPYNIEDAKFAFYSQLGNADQFLQQYLQGREDEVESFISIFVQYQYVLKEQVTKLAEWWDEKEWQMISGKEQQLLYHLRKVLVQIINNLIYFARQNTEILDRIVEKSKGKVGVILMHALSENYHDMDEYAGFLKKKGMTVYNVRLPGHGRDDIDFYATTTIPEMEAFAISAFKYFYRYMKNLTGDGRFYVIGNSIGTMITTEILAKKNIEGKYLYQAMVKGFISIANPIFLWHIKAFIEMISTRKNPSYRHNLSLKQERAMDRVLTGTLVPGAFTLMSKFTHKAAKPKVPEDNRRKGNLAYNANKTIASMGQQLLRLREAVKHIQIPVLVVQGKKDRITHPKSAPYIARNVQQKHQLKKLRMLILPNSGHSPMLDEGRDRLFETSLKFIAAAEEQSEKFDDIREVRKSA